MKKLSKLFSGAIILSIGAFVGKVLGAVYRIPLTRLLGGYGIGLYQMVFPVYVVMLEFSGAGLPNALSKLISENATNEGDKKSVAKEYLKIAKKIFLPLGLILSVIMAGSSYFISKLQGNTDAVFAYITLSPAVFFVCILSCYRGYFQGLNNMKPTAISQIIEQSTKLGFGLLIAFLLLPNVPLAVGGVALAITISEVIAVLFLKFRYYHFNKNSDKVSKTTDIDRTNAKRLIIKYTIPITLTGIIIPLSQVLDSFLIVNILSKVYSDATTRYGLLSGVVMTIINLPVSICYGVAVAVIPSVAGEKDLKKKDKNAKQSILLTLAVSVPAMLFFYFLSDFIITTVFSSLSDTELNIAVNLLKICSPIVVLLSLLQTVNAILIGYSKIYTPTVSMSIAVLIKTVVNIVLLRTSLNIYGAGVGLIACYFVADLVNLILLKRGKINANKKTLLKRQVYIQ